MFGKIKSSTEYVMRNSQHVKINYDKLNDFIKEKYADYKADFFSSFVIQACEYALENMDTDKNE